MNQRRSVDDATGNRLAPLVLDLDGTLTSTDTLLESAIRVLKRAPANALLMPFWLRRGRAYFKAAIATRCTFPADLLPYRQELLAYLKTEKARGRVIVLATAAHRSIAEAVAAHLGIFDQVLASDENDNLKGTSKLARIQETVGMRFVYAGDSSADLPIWKAAESAVLVGVSTRVARQVRSFTAVEREFPSLPVGIHTWGRALRIHQWVKNLLLFVPLLTAFSFNETSKLIPVMIAFVAFSLAASASYIVNDIADAWSDRAHPRKRSRPFASASISIPAGLLVAASALVLALALATAVSPTFLILLAFYLGLTSAYSWAFKEYVLIDVLMLSVLYTLRILGGAIAAGVATSSWLIAFSVFLFLSLALVKRCSELVSLGDAGRESTRGRDYQISDLTILWPLGIGAGLSAVVVFGLFISAIDTQAKYASPKLLWLVVIGLIYWLGRLWIKTNRGEMHDDPVVFACKDFGSRVTIVAMVAVTVAAYFLHI